LTQVGVNVRFYSKEPDIIFHIGGLNKQNRILVLMNVT